VRCLAETLSGHMPATDAVADPGAGASTTAAAASPAALLLLLLLPALMVLCSSMSSSFRQLMQSANTCCRLFRLCWRAPCPLPCKSLLIRGARCQQPAAPLQLSV